MTKPVYALTDGKGWRDHIIPQRENTVCVSRYGAFGDMIQTSSVFPGLKEQGFRVCVNTTPKGMDIVRNDPHVDEFLIQKDNQVPNEELWKWWMYLAGKFSKFFIMSEIVEGSLLALPGRRAYRWAPDFRRLVMDVNYLQAHHAVCEIPFNPAPNFYPSNSEATWAKRYRQKLGLKNFVVMWSIAGSSVHKVYPYMDAFIARLLYFYRDIRIILVGDYMSSVVEYDWRSEQRVIRKCGKWSIRESLAMAQQCDLVVGPETGVMNSVSFHDMPKILLLSHSSRNNIGGDWVNTTVMTPKDVDCYPCHKLHYGWDTCNRDEETGTAKCAAGIPIDDVFSAAEFYIGNKIQKIRSAA